MNEPQRDGRLEGEPAPQPARQMPVPRIIGWAIFGLLSVGLFGFVAYFASLHLENSKHIAALVKQRDALKKIDSELTAYRARGDSDKRVAMKVLQLCRVPEDIPDFQSAFAVSHQQGYEKLYMYIPEGSHSLEIKSDWKSPKTNGEDTSDESTQSGEKNWVISPLPPGGYLLEIKAAGQPGPIRWKLTSNIPQFPSREETLPIDGASVHGAAWSGSGSVLFPNQITTYTAKQMEEAAISPPGIDFMNVTLNGKRQDRVLKIHLTAKLITEGRACVSATHALRILGQGRSELLLPYQGHGKYELNPAEAKRQ